MSEEKELQHDNEHTFKNYKEKQNYYKEKYKNRGETVWISKIIDGRGNVKQNGKTYIKNEPLFNRARATKAKEHLDNECKSV